MTTIDPSVSLPLATRTTPGAVIVGDGLDVADGVVSVAGPGIDLSGAVLKITSNDFGMATSITLSGVIISETVNGSIPSRIYISTPNPPWSAGGTASGTSQIPISSLPVESDDVLTSSGGSSQPGACSITVVDSSGIALCDPVNVNALDGGGEPGAAGLLSHDLLTEAMA